MSDYDDDCESYERFADDNDNFQEYADSGPDWCYEQMETVLFPPDLSAKRVEDYTVFTVDERMSGKDDGCDHPLFTPPFCPPEEQKLEGAERVAAVTEYYKGLSRLDVYSPLPPAAAGPPRLPSSNVGECGVTAAAVFATHFGAAALERLAGATGVTVADMWLWLGIKIWLRSTIFKVDVERSDA